MDRTVRCCGLLADPVAAMRSLQDLGIPPPVFRTLTILLIIIRHEASVLPPQFETPAMVSVVCPSLI